MPIRLEVLYRKGYIVVPLESIKSVLSFIFTGRLSSATEYTVMRVESKDVFQPVTKL